MESVRGKKVLVLGLGLLGGGVSTTNWLLKHGARVTVTDLKTKEQLAPALKKIKGRVRLRLWGHSKADIRSHDIIVVNPDVPADSEYVQYARRLKKQIENDASLFFTFCTTPIIAITGTRGKTTTAAWTHHFLSWAKRSVIAGNRPDVQFLNVVDRTASADIAVAEMPSFQLELIPPRPAPQVAVITNLYQDHLNRHKTMRGYALAKANLFKFQQPDDILIINADNSWTPFFLKRRPQGHIWFFSASGRLKRSQNGIFSRAGAAYYQFAGKRKKVLDLGDFGKRLGRHNLENLLASVLAAFLAGVPGGEIQKRIPTLPQVPFRQEVVYKNKRLMIVNDTTATSPEGSIAAVKRFAAPLRSAERSRSTKDGWPEVILIAGGTDRNLDFREWARVIPKHIKPKHIIFLSGSATQKMLASLPRGLRQYVQVLGTLSETFDAAMEKASRAVRAVVVFSPGAKSFELFKNEYDRGEQFSRLVKRRMR